MKCHISIVEAIQEKVLLINRDLKGTKDKQIAKVLITLDLLYWSIEKITIFVRGPGLTVPGRITWILSVEAAQSLQVIK
jgi:hypothetical protein